ncbi:hypothetical protein GCM10010245_84230 [Streptomyces spectabilis]|nr:hypothetical protein GCM10010245_84230 [Streptomyces spectabilis]
MGKHEFRRTEVPEPGGGTHEGGWPRLGTARDSEPLVPPTVFTGPGVRTRSHERSGQRLGVDLSHLILTQIKNLLVRGLNIR